MACPLRVAGGGLRGSSVGLFAVGWFGRSFDWMMASLTVGLMLILVLISAPLGADGWRGAPSPFLFPTCSWSSSREPRSPGHDPCALRAPQSASGRTSYHFLQEPHAGSSPRPPDSFGHFSRPRRRAGDQDTSSCFPRAEASEMPCLVHGLCAAQPRQPSSGVRPQSLQ